MQTKYGKSEFEKQHQALFSLMCIYGIELLEDNVEECKEILLETFVNFLKIDRASKFCMAAKAILNVNIIHGDALSLTKISGEAIEFSEWGYLGTGKFQRRDFRYDALTQRSSIHGTLFELFEENQLFVPTNTHPLMNVEELAK